MSMFTNKRFGRPLLGVVIAAMLAAGIGFGYSHSTSAKQAVVPPLAQVSVAKVASRQVTEWDSFSGRVEAVESVEIRPRVPGTIDVVHFQDGQIVKKGDALFTIDPRPYQADLAKADATLSGARARAALAATEEARTRRLLDDHAVSQRELDEREDATREAAAGLASAEANVQSARLNLEYTSIKAPITGRVSRAELTVGNLVASGPTAPVLTSLVSVSPVYVDFDVDEATFLRYAATGAAGNAGVATIPVEMGLANEEGYSHRGHILSIDNRLNTTSGTIRLRALFDNTDRVLTPGMYAKVRTASNTGENAVVIDDRAVGTDQDKRFVMVLGDDNKVAYRQVTLGPVSDGLRIVRTGLKPGERIVVDGLQRVRPNDTVNPTEIAMRGSDSSTTLSAAAPASNKL